MRYSRFPKTWPQTSQECCTLRVWMGMCFFRLFSPENSRPQMEQMKKPAEFCGTLVMSLKSGIEPAGKKERKS